MKREGLAVAEKGCDASDVRVQSVTVIASVNAIQLTGDSRDAVVRSAVNGTFLIRQRKVRPSSQCPLLCYEVRRIDVGVQQDRPEYAQESGGQSGGDVFTHQPTGITVSACAFHSPPRGCDRDERGTP